MVDATTIDVTYSEDVANATVATNYTLTDPNGNPVAINNVVRRGNTNTYRLTVASMAAGGNYTLSISNNITDTSVSANRLAPYTTTLAVGDLQPPTVGANAVTINDARDRIYIEYSEPMATTGTYSALDVNNYRTAVGATGAQSALPTGTTITQNGKIVTIALPSALPANQTHLVIGQVADAAGNRIAELQTVRNMQPAAAGFNTTIDQVRVTDRETVTFRVGRHLRAVNAALITADLGTANDPTDDIAGQSATFVNNADGTATVTVKFGTAGTPNPFATDLSGIDGIDLAAGALTDINNLTSAAFADVEFAADADRVAPAFASIAGWGNRSARTLDFDNDGQIDQIQVAFTEDLYAASVHESDFTVNGYKVTRVDVENDDNIHGVTGAGSIVTLTLQEKATPDTGVTPEVTLVGSVQDNSPQRNELGPQAAVTPFDAAGPVITSAVFNDNVTNNGTIDNNETLTITFSEPVTVTAANRSAITALELDAFLDVNTGNDFATVAHTFNSAAGVTGALSADGRTLTITFTDVTGLDIVVGDFIRARPASQDITDGTNEAPAVTDAAARRITDAN